MKKYLLGLFAVVLAIGFSAFTKVNVNKVDPNAKFTTYYFQFTGTLGTQEDDETKWTEITSIPYSTLSCPGTFKGCKLKTTSIQTVGSTNYPSFVDVGTSTSPNLTPIVTTNNFEVKNKEL